jgi:hypothetical protein
MPGQKSSMNLKPSHFPSLPKLEKNGASGVFSRRARSIAGQYTESKPMQLLSKDFGSSNAQTDQNPVMLNKLFRDEILSSHQSMAALPELFPKSVK